MRMAVAIVVVGVVLPISMGRAQPSGNWPPPRCPTGLLVAYYVGDGLSFNDDLVIGTDGHALLCWGRHGPSSTSGKESFTVARTKLALLKLELSRIGIQRLGPARTQPCCDRPTASLVYKGKEIPSAGYPESNAGIIALRSAQGILNGIIKERSPDHQTVRVIQPVA
jgi:hypothetical protein